EQANGETIVRGLRYREAGCDGLFVPYIAERESIREIVAAIDLPINAPVVPTLPSPDELGKLGVSGLSTGSGVAQAAYGLTKRAATEFFEGGYGTMLERTMDYMQMNALFFESLRYDSAVSIV